MSAPPLASAVPVFAALGDPYRWSIVARLCADGPLPTTGLSHDAGGVSRQGLTKHLRVLEDAGLVESFRVGRDRHWQVRADQLNAAGTCLDRAAAAWDTRLARLHALVSEDGRERERGGV